MSSAASLALLEQLGALDLARAGGRPVPPAGRSPASIRREATRRALVPAGIDDARSRAVVALLDRIGGLDLAPVLVYHVDTVPATALYALAWQFGLTGDAGWDLAETDAQRRALLRRAVEWHRHAGTPWVVKQVLAALGFGACVVEEGYGRSVYDGASRYDGVIDYSAGVSWGVFRVLLGALPSARPVDAAYRARVEAVVNAWKNARSQLVELAIPAGAGADPLAPVTDRPMDLSIELEPDYDGTQQYDGAVRYGPTALTLVAA